MHLLVNNWGIEPQLLTAYPSQRRLSGRRGASGVFAKKEIREPLSHATLSLVLKVHLLLS